MSDLLQFAMTLLHIANLAVSVLLFKLLVEAYYSKQRSFSRATKFMFVAVLMFFVAEMVQFFKIFSAEESQFLQALFTLVFMFLLFCATSELRKSSIAHDHLMRRKLRSKVSDVD